MMHAGRVLVVDDAREILDLISGSLSREGYEVLVAQSPLAAIEIVRGCTLPDASVPDLIISDVMMPGMTGPQMVAEIRKILPGPPVLFMSGYSCCSILPDHAYFLEKPFTIPKLVSKIREVMAASIDGLRTERLDGDGANRLRERAQAAGVSADPFHRKSGT